jgi:hypothetical protein
MVRLDVVSPGRNSNFNLPRVMVVVVVVVVVGRVNDLHEVVNYFILNYWL